MVKNPPAVWETWGAVRSPGGGQGNPLQCSCLENPTDRGAWQAPVHGVTKRHDWVAKHSIPAEGEVHSVGRGRALSSENVNRSGASVALPSK